METRQKIPSPRRLSSVALGVAVGLAAALLLVVATAGVAGDGSPVAAVDATHLPPLLTLADEPVRLAYDLNCAADDNPSGCEGAGTAYIRRGTSGAFAPYPLTFDPTAASGRYSVAVPAAIAHAAEGFTYYAVLKETSSGASVTVPAGGADAPDSSLPLGDPIAVAIGSPAFLARSSRAHVSSSSAVRIGVHPFSRTRSATERVAAANWGDGPGEVGLEGGRQNEPIGASSFDVTPTGDVVLLDEAHKQLVRWSHGKRVAATPVAVNGTIADLALDPDGSAYVLESTGDRTDERPTLRHFDAQGGSLASWHAAEHAAAAVRIGDNGPALLEYPSNQWMDAADGSTPLHGAAQTERAQAGRPLADGSRVVVLRTASEIRLALLRQGRPRITWRITNELPVAEVQLTQPLRQGVAVVFRIYGDSASAFVVLVLGRAGVVQQFTIPAADWADTAPVSRFRLAGGSLFQLGSTPSGVFVDRYDLGG
jgi:hypothetical protein